MPPKKGTKAYQVEYVMVFYGIHPDSYAVETVWLTRSGSLIGPRQHGYVRSPASAGYEIRIVWGLTDIISLPRHMFRREYMDPAFETLRAKAAAQKAAAEKYRAEGGFRAGPVAPDREP